jgi:hypothetical protein
MLHPILSHVWPYPCVMLLQARSAYGLGMRWANRMRRDFRRLDRRDHEDRRHHVVPVEYERRSGRDQRRPPRYRAQAAM